MFRYKEDYKNYDKNLSIIADLLVIVDNKIIICSRFLCLNV